jgi:cation transport regulator ChaC
VNLYFAYGSNMHPDVMATHAPTARSVGVGALANHRFVITADGFASIELKRTQTVYGVIWRIGSRDRVRLDAWENIAGGLYQAKNLPVQNAGHRYIALTYIARQRPDGRAKAGYMELVIAAALEWQLPPPYIAQLRRFLPKRPCSVTWRSLKEYGWT